MKSIYLMTFLLFLNACQKEVIWKDINDQPMEKGFKKAITLSNDYTLNIYETFEGNLEIKLLQFGDNFTTGLTLGNTAISEKDIRFVDLDGDGQKEVLLQPYDRSSTFGYYHTVIIFLRGIYWELLTTNLDRAMLKKKGRQWYFREHNNDTPIWYKDGYLIRQD